MAGNDASTPTAARPTTTALPPARRQSQASRIVSGRPTTSKAWSAPPPVSSRTAAAGSSAVASTACVAPRASESSSIAGSRSTATIAPAPASTRPAMTCWPTPPQPITAALSPMRGRATLRTAPMPVTAPQPSSAACHSGTPGASGTTPAAATTVRSAKHATVRPCWSGVPSGSASRDVPSISVPRNPASPAGPQSVGRPARQALQAPHDGIMQKTTRSPGATCTTPSPTASTVPAPSCPSTIGQRPGAEAARGEVHVGVADARRRRCAPAPRPPAAARARPPRRARRRARAGRRPSCDPPVLERVEVGRDAEAGARRRRDRAVGRDLDDRGQQPVAPLGRPRRAGRRAPRRTGTSRRRA